MSAKQQPCLVDLAEDSLSELYRRFHRPLSAYFSKRVTEQHDVEDLVQEVFLNLQQRSENLDIQSIDGYIFRTAANVIKVREHPTGLCQPVQGQGRLAASGSIGEALERDVGNGSALEADSYRVA